MMAEVLMVCRHTVDHIGEILLVASWNWEGLAGCFLGVLLIEEVLFLEPGQ